MSDPYLCGVGDGGQLQVLRVPPTEEAALSRHGQAAIAVGGHLHDVHSGQVPGQLGGHAGDTVVTQTCQDGQASLPATDSGTDTSPGFLRAEHSVKRFTRSSSARLIWSSARATASFSTLSQRRNEQKSECLFLKPWRLSKADSS